MKLYIQVNCMDKSMNRCMVSELPDSIDLSSAFLLCDLSGGKVKLPNSMVDRNCFEALLIIISNSLKSFYIPHEVYDPTMIPDENISEIVCGFGDTGYVYRYVEHKRIAFDGSYDTLGVDHTIEKIGKNKKKKNRGNGGNGLHKV